MKCKVCGKHFKLQADKRYEVVKHTPFCYPTFYECFDCPKCGCQNIMQERDKSVGELKDERE